MNMNDPPPTLICASLTPQCSQHHCSTTAPFSQSVGVCIAPASYSSNQFPSFDKETASTFYSPQASNIFPLIFFSSFLSHSSVLSFVRLIPVHTTLPVLCLSPDTAVLLKPTGITSALHHWNTLRPIVTTVPTFTNKISVLLCPFLVTDDCCCSLVVRCIVCVGYDSSWLKLSDRCQFFFWICADINL